MRHAWAQYGNTVASDGASTCTGTPFLNLLYLSHGVVVFEHATDCTGKTKDARFVADFVIAGIMAQKNPESTVQVLMGG